MRFIVIDMPKNEVRIYNSKAVIYQNDYDVWQFRMWLADEDKYIRQSLRTKDKAKAIADAEALYEDIKYRQTRNPNRSNARYSLSTPIAVDSLQTAFALCDLIEQAEANGEKVNNYALAKQVGIKVKQRNTEEEWDVAYKRRVASVAVSRKKKVAIDAIKSVVNGVFPR